MEMGCGWSFDDSSSDDGNGPILNTALASYLNSNSENANQKYGACNTDPHQSVFFAAVEYPTCQKSIRTVDTLVATTMLTLQEFCANFKLDGQNTASVSPNFSLDHRQVRLRCYNSSGVVYKFTPLVVGWVALWSAYPAIRCVDLLSSFGALILCVHLSSLTT
jgi:hypothetical protein